MPQRTDGRRHTARLCSKRSPAPHMIAARGTDGRRGERPPEREEEPVLHQEGDEEEDDALQGHGEHVLPGQVPAQRGHEPLVS